MDVTVDDARNRLDQLLELAASGVEIIVTREGKSPVRLIRGEDRSPKKPRLTGAELRAAIDKIVSEVDAMDIPPEHRTSNHDDLYDEHGLPK